ncbi:MAG: beta-ketoacyl-ACP synthase 3 [Peptoanaerobacter stomatis]
MGLEIKKTSSYLPEKIVENSEFEKYLDTSDEWISSRTGIKVRHFAKNETTSDMISKVCEGFELTEEERSKIKAVIVSSLTPDSLMPNMACHVQNFLGLNEDIFATDINMACSGFAGGVTLIEGILQDGDYGIVIGAEKLSGIINLNDRNTAVLFGDGAGGVLVKKNNDISACDFGASYSADALKLRDFRESENYVSMDGKKVYRFAVDVITKSIENVLAKLNKKPEDITYFISHQANEKILKSACRKWNVPIDKFPMNLQSVGNTSSASIPLILDEVNKKGMLKKGDEVIFCGFGGGLTWVSYYVKW